MPILGPEYIAALHCFYNTGTGRYLLLDTFTDTQTQDVDVNKFIQGSLGTQIMNIGATSRICVMQSPIFIFDSNPPIDSTINIYLNALSDPLFRVYDNLAQSTSIVLHKATINIDAAQGVTCSVTLLGDNVFVPNWLSVTDANAIFGNNFLIGRIAKFYDTTLLLGNLNYNVMSGSINIDVDISKQYFINATAPIANFAVTGYRIAGSLKVAYPVPNLDPNFYAEITPQIPNSVVTDSDSLILNVGTFGLNFSRTPWNTPVRVVYKESKKSISPKEIITSTIEFESYAIV